MSSTRKGPFNADEEMRSGASLTAALDRLDANLKAKAERERRAAWDNEKPRPPATVPAPASSRSQSLREPPEGDQQPDFFVPSLYDIPVKDGIDLMDVAVFRLAKRQTRRGDIIRYNLSDATIEVAGGAHGMATIWDYDLVLMMISHLAEATRRFRAGHGPKPTNKFRPHAVEIFKFCRLPDGGQQYENLSNTLDRLQGTYIKITHHDLKSRKRRVGHFPLLGGADVVSHTETGRIGQVELIIPEWIFDGVSLHKTPEVLTVDPDYLLIRGGLARFVYRLARKAAGTKEARYYFRSVHERSGSTREFKKFAHDLREIILRNDLPGYMLAETPGKEGPMLIMTPRNEPVVANG